MCYASAHGRDIAGGVRVSRAIVVSQYEVTARGHVDGFTRVHLTVRRREADALPERHEAALPVLEECGWLVRSEERRVGKECRL